MILLDTHVWIWWSSEPERLSAPARFAIEQAESVGVSPISIWEIATKVVNGKLSLDRPLRLWIAQAIALPKVELVGITAEIAVLAGELGATGFHGDPADRLLVATSLVRNAPLLTRDERIRSSPGVRCIW